jgi:hypothetical protein
MFELFFQIVSQLSSFDNLALIGLIFIALIIAFKVFQFFIKSAIVGLMFGLVVIGLWYIGFSIKIQHVLLAVLFGILFSIAYSAISTIARAFGLLLPKKKKKD